MPGDRKKILILGGGFAGMYAAKYLEGLLQPGEAEISLVNQEVLTAVSTNVIGAAPTVLNPRRFGAPSSCD